jgi:hypothetical protein
MKLNTLLVLLLSAVTIASAHAAEDNMDYSSAYFNLGAGYGLIQNLPTGTGAVSAAVGYQFNRYLGLEVDWDGMPSEQWGKLYNYNIYSLAVKGILPLSNSFELYGKLGSGIGYSTWTGNGDPSSVYNSNGSATALDGIVGVGAAFTLSPQFKLYLENKTFVPLTDQIGHYTTANATMFGFQFNFSAPSAIPSSSVSSAASNNLSAATQPQAVVSPSPAIRADIATSANPAPAAMPQAKETSHITITDQIDDEANFSKDFGRRVRIENGREYIIIQKNDTLFSISRESKTSLEQLRAINHLQKSNLIKLGTKLYLN